MSVASTLPREVMQGAERVWQYHRLSKLTGSTPIVAPDLSLRLSPTRSFEAGEKFELSRKLLDLPTSTLQILEQGAEALPESMRSPPQDLQTLSTWLYMAVGQRGQHRFEWGNAALRAYPSNDATYPAEIYVAAFAVEGLPAGLYHFSPSTFSLRKLRDGPETLSLLRRGRPDLHFLGSVPAALIVSTVFSRACWRLGPRGYRQALIDTGHAIENCHLAAAGLGMDTQTRIRLTDGTTRELIGLPEELDFPTAESVQGLIVWADRARQPLVVSPVAVNGRLPEIPRPPAGACEVFDSVLSVHREMIVRGVATREIRSPLTELTPMPSNYPMMGMMLAAEDTPSKPLRVALTDVHHAEAFERRPLGRELFCRIARAGFRSGTHYPLKPDGPHTGIVRGFWIVLEVPGQDPGIWWHDPARDHWALLNHGHYKFECCDLTRSRTMLENASAVCVVVANLQRLLLEAGPDAYRLALIETGIAVQRMTLASQAFGFASRCFGDFHDDTWRQFLGLSSTGWEPLAVFAVGGIKKPPAIATPVPRVRPGFR